MSLEKITELHGELVGAIFTTLSELEYSDLAEKFVDLANTIHAYKGDNEDWVYLGECGHCPISDLIVGAYWHYTEWHNGQYSDSYAALSALGQVFSPGMSSAPKDDDSSEGECYNYLNEMAIESQK